MNYARSLRFDDKPDYAYLRKIFRDLFLRLICTLSYSSIGIEYTHSFSSIGTI